MNNNATLLRRRLESQRTRAQLRSKHGFVRTNERQVVKAKAAYVKWLEKIGGVLGLISLKKATNPLPVRLRPWIPGVAHTLAQGGVNADLIVASLDEICTPSQFKHLLKVYPVLRAAHRDYAG